MSDLFEIEKEINEINEQIKSLEQKRYRSQAALIEAILLGEEASDEDADYYNKYTIEILELKNRLSLSTSEYKRLQAQSGNKSAEELQKIINKIEEIEIARNPSMRKLVKCVLEGNGKTDPKDEEAFLRLTNEIKALRVKMKALKK